MLTIRGKVIDGATTSTRSPAATADRDDRLRRRLTTRRRCPVDVPAEIKKVIASNKAAQITWNSLSYTHQKEWVRAIGEAKREETKHSRIRKMMDALKAGKRVGF